MKIVHIRTSAHSERPKDISMGKCTAGGRPSDTAVGASHDSDIIYHEKLNANSRRVAIPQSMARLTLISPGTLR